MFKKILLALGAAVSIMLIPMVAWAADPFILGSEITSPAGLAQDLNKDVIWVTNAQGATVYAVDSSGKKLGEVTYDGSPKSVEGLAYDDSALYVGDLGGDRSSVVIYKLSNLAYGEQSAKSVELTYADGAHSAQAFALSSRGNIYVITSGSNPGIYRAEAPFAGGGTTLTRVVQAPEGVVDAVFSLDGNSLILRTTEKIIVMNAYKWQETASSYAIEQANPDSITLSGSGKQVLLGSSDANSVVYTQEIPTTFSTERPAVPSIAPATSSSASPSPSSSESAVSEPTQDTGVSFNGTITALLIAAGVSVLAGLIVAVRR